MEMGTLIFDIDGTICTQESDYTQAKPIQEVIDKLNKKYDEGYRIVLFTARGTETGIDWSLITTDQLKEWGVKYDDLLFGKPAGLKYIDDKGINIYQWEPDIEALASIDKIWGKEYLLSKTDKYAFKRLEILQGKNISKQLHRHKHETWHVVEGIGTAIIAGRARPVKPGTTIIIPPGMIHQVRADSEKLIIIEASTTELEDIVRFDRSFPCI
jgi:mannose-6-phosphate isomerase-like protein (cupin superfamily)